MSDGTSREKLRQPPPHPKTGVPCVHTIRLRLWSCNLLQPRITCGARTAGGRTEEVREINHRMYSPNQQRHRNRGSRPLPTRSTSKGTGGGGVRQDDAPTRARPRKTTAADHAEAETQIQSPRGVEARSSCSEGSRRAAPTATR